LWKLHGKLLTNKAKLWTSKDNWDLIGDETSVYIANFSTKNVLTVSDPGVEVTEDTMVPFKSSQMWAKGEPNEEGFYTLTSIDSGKVLTANSALSLTIEGKKIILSWTFQLQRLIILNGSSLF
jgi:hypothetical protein